MNRLLKFGLAAVALATLVAGVSAIAADSDAKKADTATTQKPPADATGTWIMRIQSPRGVQEPTLKLEKAGDKYVGALADPRGQVTTVKEVQYKDGELSFTVSGERQGQKFALEYTAKLTGDTLKGKMTVKGRNFTIPFDGHRESPAEGLWKITFVLESGQKLQSSIKVKQKDDKLVGDYIGITGQKASAKEVKFANGELSFDAPDQADNDKLVFHYAGKLDKDALKGTVSWNSAGNQKQSLKFAAEKSRKQTADVAGTWKLKVPVTKDSTFEPTLKLTQNGGAVTGTYTGEQGDTPLADAMVLGDEFTFEVNRQKDGKSYKLRYQAKVDGDALKGNVDYNFDGIMGSYDFEGKRVTPGATAKP